MPVKAVPEGYHTVTRWSISRDTAGVGAIGDAGRCERATSRSARASSLAGLRAKSVTE